MLTTATPITTEATWQLDPTRATVAFSGRANRLAPTFRAAFTSLTGTVVQTGDDVRLAVDIDVTSLRTGNRSWDELLRTLDPFAAGRFPLASYRGSAALGDREVPVDGDLELRGVLQPVRLIARLEETTADEVRLTATGEIDRRAFGVRCDLPGLGRLVPTVMRLEIAVSAQRRG
jgi:polyisoprenoid-binding protein YceI